MVEHIKSRYVSSVYDTLSSRYHSKDFTLARSEYLRTRIITISVIFAVLTPIWALFDWFLLPKESWAVVFPARLAMFLGFLLTFYICHLSRHTSTKASLLLSGITLALPGFFYAAVLMSLASSVPHSLIGYSFIPFLLVVTLAVFPFTLIESFILGMGLLVLQFFAGYIMGQPLSSQHLQDLWLLAALLFIVLSTNHFHLSLLLRLYRQATHDPLTGLLNRIALERHTEHLKTLSLRPPNTIIMLMDLDHFKKINDTYGHSVGDEVLRLFSSLLKAEMKKDQITCRYGGEEFLIISSYSTKEQMINYAERIRQLTQELQPKEVNGDAPKISVSIGLSMLRPNESIQSAIQRADERLYRGKRTGRNRVVAEEIEA